MSWARYVGLAAFPILVAVVASLPIHPPVPGAPSIAVAPVQPPIASVDRLVPYVGTLLVTDPATGRASATAFSVDASRSIWVSAAHSVLGCRTVMIGARSASMTVERIIRHPHADIALLIGGPSAPSLNVASPDSPVAEDVVAVGFPAFRPGFRTGELVAVAALHDPLFSEFSYLVDVWKRTDGAQGRDEGISGAPVLDRFGRVRGIVVGRGPSGSLISLPEKSLAELLSVVGVRTRYAAFSERNERTPGDLFSSVMGDGSVRPVYCHRS
jgi:serine protease Do